MANRILVRLMLVKPTGCATMKLMDADGTFPGRQAASPCFQK
ncbi:hypothetical protein [Paenibacillus sp. 1011MAR3C5]|nr:hypothetical protein [Paenibacillus sp. 1011MAR3C5]